MKRLYRVDVIIEGKIYEYILADSPQEAEEILEGNTEFNPLDNVSMFKSYQALEITDYIPHFDNKTIIFNSELIGQEYVTVGKYLELRRERERTPGTREYQEYWEKQGQQRLFPGVDK